MNDQRREVIFLFQSLPYADLLFVLAPDKSDYSMDSIPSFLISSFLIYLIHQIVLACYNCEYEKNNLVWIHIYFFMNIPFIVDIIIYIKIILEKKIKGFCLYGLL